MKLKDGYDPRERLPKYGEKVLGLQKNSWIGNRWAARTPAKYIFYYAPSVDKVYKFNTIRLRQSMQRYTREKRKSTRLDIVETDSIKTTINILIPIEYCKGAYEIYDIQQSN